MTFIIVSGGPYSSVPKLMPSDHFRPLLKECFTQCGSRPEDLLFVNGDPTGPIDRGFVKEVAVSSLFFLSSYLNCFVGQHQQHICINSVFFFFLSPV